MIDFTTIKELAIAQKEVVKLYIDDKLAWEKAEPAIWLCFTAEQANSTVSLNKNSSPSAISLETSVDGSTWTDYTWSGSTGTTLTLANVGDKVYMRAKDENATISKSNAAYYSFSMTGKIAASGNIQTLLKADGSRTDAPAFCYYGMFQGCTSLTTAPELPATTLANSCYMNTLRDCTSLTTAPELPAMTLANNCYNTMFRGCTSLTTAPELPATTLAEYCYFCMFWNCTSLTAAPTLPATTLANYCYQYMFYGCSKLNSITLGYTGNFSSTYFNNWVNGVAASGTFYYNGSDTTTGTSAIPSGWTVTPYTP